jgi:hypothetical protein
MSETNKNDEVEELEKEKKAAPLEKKETDNPGTGGGHAGGGGD